jgi:WD40 repeat protein
MPMFKPRASLSLVIAWTCSAVALAAEPVGRLDRHGDALPEGAIARLGTVRWGRQHIGRSTLGLRFSPDGRFVVVLGLHGRASLIDLASGLPVTWFPPRAPITTVVFSADGKTMITEGAGPFWGEIVNSIPGPKQRNYRLVRRWEVGTGKLLGMVKLERTSSFGDDHGVLSPDGRFLLGTAMKDRFGLWEVASGKQLWEIDAPPSGLGHLTISPDGRMFAAATGVEQENLRLYDLASGILVRKFRCKVQELPHGIRPPDPVFSPDGKHLVTTGGVALQIWEVASRRLVQEITAVGGPACFSQDGRTLASSTTQRLKLWEWPAMRELPHPEGPHADIGCLAFSPDGKVLAAMTNKALNLWDVATGKQIHYLAAHCGSVDHLAFSPDGKGLASGGDWDTSVYVWDVPSGRIRHRFNGHRCSATALAFSPDSALLATGEGCRWCPPGDDWETQVRIWDLSRGQLLRQVPAHRKSIWTVAFSPDGKTLASGGSGGNVRLWDVATGARIAQVPARECRQLACARDGTWLLAERERGMSIWQADLKEKLRDIGVAQRYAGWLEGGRGPQVFALTFEGGARLWDASTGIEVRSVTIPREARTAVAHIRAISPDGKLLAGTYDQPLSTVVVLWGSESGRVLARLPGHTGRITALTFSPDSKVLASGSEDTTILLWDVAQARLVSLWADLSEDLRADQAIAELSKGGEGVVPFLYDRLRLAVAQERPWARLIADLDSDRYAVREQASRDLEAAGAAAELTLLLALGEGPSAEVKRRIERALVKRPADISRELLQLMKDLDGPEAVTAFRKLQELGPAAEPTLRYALRFDPVLVDEPRTREGEDDPLLSGWSHWLIRERLERLPPKPPAPPFTPAGIGRALMVLERLGTPEARQALADIAAAPPPSQIGRAAQAACQRLERRHPGR